MDKADIDWDMVQMATLGMTMHQCRWTGKLVTNFCATGKMKVQSDKCVSVECLRCRYSHRQWSTSSNVHSQTQKSDGTQQLNGY